MLVAVLVAGLAAVAHAAPNPPPNDSIDDAQGLGSPPAQASGTTKDATSDFTEDRISGCNGNGDTGSVWYRFTTPVAGRVIVSMHANQDRFDATLNVIRQRRSRQEAVDCDSTDDSGDASVAFAAEAGAAYYVRIATQSDASPGTFTVNANPAM